MVRTWLYRIATNACLDLLESKSHRLKALESPQATESYGVEWLEPYPDRLLDEIASSDSSPDALVISRETIELAYLAAIQYLPPKQRATLILRDALGWSAKETANLLDETVASVNSALNRARSAMRTRLPERRLDWPAVVAAIREIGYDGWQTLETSPTGDPPAAAARNLAFLRQQFGD